MHGRVMKRFSSLQGIILFENKSLAVQCDINSFGIAYVRRINILLMLTNGATQY